MDVQRDRELVSPPNRSGLDPTAPTALAAPWPELRPLSADPDAVAQALSTAVMDTVSHHVTGEEARRVWAIERLRAEMDASTDPIDIALATGSGYKKLAPLGEICRQRSKNELWSLLLLLLVRRLRPERVLELGTCVGISGAYLATGLQLNGRGRMITLEGAAALSAKSAEVFHRLGLSEVEARSGLFADTLQPALDDLGEVDLAFIDGHHDEHATQDYFEQILPFLANGAVVVFDDTAWSEGMVRAWQALQRHPAVQVAVDLHDVGVCVVKSPARQYELPPLATLARRHQPSEGSIASLA